MATLIFRNNQDVVRQHRTKVHNSVNDATPPPCSRFTAVVTNVKVLKRYSEILRESLEITFSLNVIAKSFY